jgi:hypothetical protein
MGDDRTKSADRLREMLVLDSEALAMYRNETLYHVQIDLTCRLLDVVDEVTDPVTAGLITDLIYERMTGGGVSEAAERQRDAVAALDRLMRESPRPFLTS